jgi:hypothetical protein
MSFFFEHFQRTNERYTFSASAFKHEVKIRHGHLQVRSL